MFKKTTSNDEQSTPSYWKNWLGQQQGRSERIGSGTHWEKKFSYSRATRTSLGTIHVAGTTATHRNTSIGQKAFCTYLTQTKQEKTDVRIAPMIWVEGETETYYDERDNTHRNDPYAQTVFALDKIEGALYVLGASLKDVVRTRLIVRQLNRDWHSCALAHGERFRGLNPANTLIGGALVGDEYSVEIEVDAVLNEQRASMLDRVLFFMGVTFVSVALGSMISKDSSSTKRRRTRAGGSSVASKLLGLVLIGTGLKAIRYIRRSSTGKRGSE